MTRYRFIKKADDKILEQLIALYREQGWWDGSDTRGMLRRIIKNSHCFLIALENGKVAGMGRAINAYSKEAYLHDVAVLREFRGRDIGSAIVSRLTRRLKSDGILWIGLIASSNSSPFYRRLGFHSPADAKAMMLV
ncbi:MAG: GNAT family N-acetyltransferase [Elusimicrobiales bacterium]|jgi:spermidine synthase